MFRTRLSCCRAKLSFFLWDLYSRLQVLSSPSNEPLLSAVTCSIQGSAHSWLSPTSITVAVAFHVQNPYCLAVIQYLLSQPSYVWTPYPGLPPASPTLGIFCFCHVLWKLYAWAPYPSTDIFLESAVSSECCRAPGFQTP